MAGRRRRKRSPHPGVKLKKRTLPSGRVRWIARYVDPESGKERDQTLDLQALPTRETRTLWAKAKSKELATRRMDLAAGVRRAPEPVSLEAAVAEYLSTAEVRLRPNTIAAYRQSLNRMLRWAARAKVTTTAQLGTKELAALRDALIAAPKATPVRGGRRGAHKPSGKRRTVPSINADLRSIKAMLGVLRKRGQLPNLHRDDIADALATLRAPRDDPPFLTPADLRRLLEAAMRHDDATFDATRREHAGADPRGTTRRYSPLAPFVAFVLLTGCRRGEALSLQWRSVDLDALDSQGRRVGEIRLCAAGTKTHRGRTIGLEVSPALRTLLSSLRLRSGGRGYVFGGETPYTVHQLTAARARLVADFGAPEFSWKMLRSTCATYLTNAPGIFGAASIHLSSRQLGHSVAVAEKHYLGVHRGIPRDARTLDAAMQLEAALSALVGSVTAVGAPGGRDRDHGTGGQQR